MNNVFGGGRLYGVVFYDRNKIFLKWYYSTFYEISILFFASI